MLPTDLLSHLPFFAPRTGIGRQPPVRANQRGGRDAGGAAVPAAARGRLSMEP